MSPFDKADSPSATALDSLENLVEYYRSKNDAHKWYIVVDMIEDEGFVELARSLRQNSPFRTL